MKLGLTDRGRFIRDHFLGTRCGVLDNGLGVKRPAGCPGGVKISSNEGIGKNPRSRPPGGLHTSGGPKARRMADKSCPGPSSTRGEARARIKIPVYATKPASKRKINNGRRGSGAVSVAKRRGNKTTIEQALGKTSAHGNGENGSELRSN